MPKQEQIQQDEKTVLIANPDEIDKQRLIRDVKRGEARAQQLLNERKKSPKGMYIAPTVNQFREQLERRYLPESFCPYKPEEMFDRGTANGKPYSVMKKEFRGIYKPGATKQGYWSAQEYHNRTIERGYIPVLNEAGEHVNDGNGDYFYWRPIELTRDAIAAADHTSRERMVQMDRAMAAAQSDGGKAAVSVTEDVTEVIEQPTP